MALIRNPVTIVQESGGGAEYEEQANDYGTTAIIAGYTTEANTYGQTAITSTQGMPEDYPGPYTVTENGTVPCSGKRMTSDLTVNVAQTDQTPQEFTATLSETADYVYNVPDNVRITKITIPKIKSSDITNLKAGNIRSGVKILDLTGTYASSNEVTPLYINVSQLTSNKIYDATELTARYAGYNPVYVAINGGSTSSISEQESTDDSIEEDMDIIP